MSAHKLINDEENMTLITFYNSKIDYWFLNSITRIAVLKTYIQYLPANTKHEIIF